MTAAAHGFPIGGGRRNDAARRARSVALHVAGCVLASGAVLVGGIHLVNAADWSGLERSRASLDAARERAAAAERQLAAAAQQRGADAVPTSERRERGEPGWAVLMLELADLAASSGLRIVSIEPQLLPGAHSGPDARRTVRVVADGSFPALRQMIDGLPTLPALAVPAAMRVERDASVARVELSLDVFPALPGGAVADGSGPVAADAPDADPFGMADEPASGSASLSRLAGVMRDGRASLALFDDGEGVITAVAAGETVGALRVVRVDADAVTLATADGARRMGLDGGGGPW